VVEYSCTDAQLREAISFRLRLINRSDESIPLTSVTLRYWFTTTAFDQLLVACDFASVQSMRGGCPDILPSSAFRRVTPALPLANTFLEIGFGSGAGTMSGFHDDATDQIYLRIYAALNSPMDQTDDYSYDCSTPGSEKDSPLITAYVNGKLVFGREPR
jgi:hypothetical protein